MLPQTPQVRFLLPVLPLFNLGAAVALVRVTNNRRKSRARALAWLVTLSLLAASTAASAFMLFVSAHNYPGGQALYSLHLREAAGGPWFRATTDGRGQPDRKVHVGVLPAMTGVSRFLELDGHWMYSKVQRHPQLINQSISHPEVAVACRLLGGTKDICAVRMLACFPTLMQSSHHSDQLPEMRCRVSSCDTQLDATFGCHQC